MHGTQEVLAMVGVKRGGSYMGGVKCTEVQSPVAFWSRPNQSSLIACISGAALAARQAAFSSCRLPSQRATGVFKLHCH